MESRSAVRQGLGTLLLTTALTINPLFDAEAATQGRLGKTSSGSFTITLVVHPSLSSQVAVVDNETLDEAGNPTVIPTDTLSFGKPVALCVAGRGLSQFSLAAEGNEGVFLQVNEASGTTPITGEPSDLFATQANCQNNTRSLSAIPARDIQDITQPSVLIIHAE